MSAYYNEIDPYCAAWLRNLIGAGHIAPGDVDERSIVGVRADDLRGYTQCHFFAGIGGWSLALRLAGWPDECAVWTGSCPCQPLSGAGQRKGHADERHLWPAFHSLIAECAPAVVFGEQVASADGREWFSAVRADLEATGYAVGAADLCAAGVGAPHIRQRLWFVGHATRGDVRRIGGERLGTKTPSGCEWSQAGRGGDDPGASGAIGGLADSAGPGRSARSQRPAGENGRPSPEPGRLRDAGGLAVGGGAGLEIERIEPARGQRAAAERGGAAGELGDTALQFVNGDGNTKSSRRGESANTGFWSDCDWLRCTDGKARPAKPGIQPLAHGVPARVAKLRAVGNSIVPQIAAEFIAAFMDCRP